jgi:hypothetical protein
MLQLTSVDKSVCYILKGPGKLVHAFKTLRSQLARSITRHFIVLRKLPTTVYSAGSENGAKL